MELRRRTSIVAVLGLVWLILVVGGYFVYHKPFTAEQLSIWLKFAYQTFIGLFIIACAGGLGLRILERFYPDHTYSVVQCAALGLGILGTAYLGLGWLVGVRWYWSVLWLGFLTIGCWQTMVRWGRGLLNQIQEMMPNSRYAKVLATLLGFMLLCGYMTAISPPITFDALVYHLSLPMTYLQTGKFVFLPANPFWGMPQLGEMLYTLSISLSGVEAGPLLGWMMGLLSLVGIGEVLKDSLSWEEIWVALAALLCGFTFVDSLSWGYVDWMTFLWGVCAVQTLRNFLIQPQLRNISLAAIFCGFALGTKYTAGILVLAVMLAVFLFYPRQFFLAQKERGLRPLWASQWIRVLVFFSVVFLLTSLPWWLKNFLVVKQPFYPLLFEAGEMSSLRIRFYSGLEPYGNWWTSLFLPITATMLGVEGKEGFNASIGPLFLLLAPFSVAFLFAGKEEKESLWVKLSLSFALTAWVVWGVGARLAGYLIQSRLYWAVFPSLVILCGFGYRTLRSLRLGEIRIWAIFNGAILFVLILTAVEVFTSTVQKRVLDFIGGQIDRQAYLTHNLGWHYLTLQEVKKRASQERVLLLFEPRSLYCLPKCDGDEILDEWYSYSLFPPQSIEEIVRVWRERGYQAVLIFHQGAQFVRQHDRRYSNDQWELFDRLTLSLPVIQQFGDVYTLYALP